MVVVAAILHRDCKGSCSLSVVVVGIVEAENRAHSAVVEAVEMDRCRLGLKKGRFLLV